MPESAKPKSAKFASSFLYESPSARLNGQLDLGFGRSCAIWVNSNDRVRYEQLVGHTFSFYKNGGRGTWRVDERSIEGHPGAVSIFPHGQSSEWLVSKPLEMLHLYMPDAELRRFFSEMLDRDSRMLDLIDVTYADAGWLEGPFRALYAAILDEQPMRAEEAMVELVSQVFRQDHYCKSKLQPIKGGLSPVMKGRLEGYIEAHLDGVIRLQDLATLAGLSEFHLQRSFKQSCGVSPHVYISHRRIERAREMIASGEPLAQIAEACGLSSQSHLTRLFKLGTGMTPKAYRACMG